MKHNQINLEIERTLWTKGIENIAGMDEAGRGPLAGPVVSAAVIFPKEIIIEGVNDSKKLTANQREELFKIISEQALGIGIGIVSHEVIDRINILQATILSMRKALDELKLTPGFVLVDGNHFKHDILRFQNVVGGDAKSFTIAAASIVAKVTRDRIMSELDVIYPQYGFEQHKGYGTRRHIEAIRKHGLCEIHRKSFHPVVLQANIP